MKEELMELADQISELDVIAEKFATELECIINDTENNITSLKDAGDYNTLYNSDLERLFIRLNIVNDYKHYLKLKIDYIQELLLKDE